MALLIALIASALPACTQNRPPERQVVGQFVGTFDAPTGKLIMTGVPVGPRPRTMASAVSVTGVPDVKDGSPGSGPLGTVEIVTEGAVRSGPSGCGRADSICADVTVRSFFAGNELHNVFVELSSVSSTSNYGFWNTADPSGGNPGVGQVTSLNGALWAYPALLDSNRGAYPGGTAPGANAATRTWYFNNPGNTSFTFIGSVWADVTDVATGLQGRCGAWPGTATDLNSLTNCGECGRTNNGAGGTTCTYVNSSGSSQATSRLTFTPSCSGGQTACDTTDSLGFACHDLQTETANCGVCGNSCGTGNSCSAGVCTSAIVCSVGTKCGTVCCPDGSTCSAGLCILSDANEVSVGAQHACSTTTTTRLPNQVIVGGAPTIASNVVCWGRSWMATADIGYSSPVAPAWSAGVAVPEYTPSLALGTPFHGVAAGGTFSSALYFPATGVADWGLHFNTNIVEWVTISSQSGLAAGGAHVCSFDNTTLYSVDCWGSNGVGQLGIGSTGAVSPVPLWWVLGVDATTPGDVNSWLVATQLAASGDTTCAVLGAETAPIFVPSLGTSIHGLGQTAGTVACWGDNTNGKAGLPSGTTSSVVPRLVRLTSGGTPLAGATMVSVGGNHGVALTSTGLAFWGQNARGQFGDGTTAAGNLVTTVPLGVTVTSIAAGQDFTCYTTGGIVYCAGANDRGQLGDGSTTDRHGFVQVVGLPAGITSVRAGGVPKTGNTAYGSACALDGAKHVYCWGDNTSGQAGAGALGGFYTTPQPVQLAPLP